MKTNPVVKIAFVKSPTKDIINIWHRVYCDELNWANDIDHDFIYDDYSKTASYVFATVSGRPVGTARLVYPYRSMLPVERNAGANLLCEPPLHKCELTRLMVLPEARGTPVCGEIMFHCIQALRRVGFDRLFMDVVNQDTTPNMVDYLIRSFGFEDLKLKFKSQLTPNGPDCTAMMLSL